MNPRDIKAMTAYLKQLGQLREAFVQIDARIDALFDLPIDQVGAVRGRVVEDLQALYEWWHRIAPPRIYAEIHERESYLQAAQIHAVLHLRDERDGGEDKGDRKAFVRTMMDIAVQRRLVIAQMEEISAQLFGEEGVGASQ